jgi:hypothetical protein
MSDGMLRLFAKGGTMADPTDDDGNEAGNAGDKSSGANGNELQQLWWPMGSLERRAGLE